MRKIQSIMSKEDLFLCFASIIDALCLYKDAATLS